MTIDGNRIWHLQLVGRLADHEHQHGSPQPIGSRIFLQPGTLLDAGFGLGFTHQACLPLPADLPAGPWMLEAYQCWDAPEGGTMACELRLIQPLLMHRPLLEALPPCAIQLGRDRQPVFELCRVDLNPCPGWSERIHLYQHPGKPFETSAVIYLNGKGEIAAAELFQVSLRSPEHEWALVTQRRSWIRFSN